MKGQLFEYAIIHHPKPTKDQRDAGVTPDSKIVQEPKWTLAPSSDQVSIVAARSIPEEFMGKLDEVEIIVRPFGLAGR